MHHVLRHCHTDHHLPEVFGQDGWLEAVSCLFGSSGRWTLVLLLLPAVRRPLPDAISECMLFVDV